MAVQFDPMRSLIYVDCVNEKYRDDIKTWLFDKHVPDSISQFEPYVTKYAFYDALPVPADSDRFGVVNVQLTEHYWLFNPHDPSFAVKTFAERVDVSALKGSGVLPDDDRITNESMKMILANADNIRNNETEAPAGEGVPFIFVFVPVCWQEEYKGFGRTIDDGENYRWQILFNFPEECSEEEADRWFCEEFIPVFRDAPEVTRILSSKIRKDVNGTPYDRLCEIWFADENDWHKVAVEGTADLKKPEWGKTNEFPFMIPKFEFCSIMLGDYVTHNNLKEYTGPIMMR